MTTGRRAFPKYQRHPLSQIFGEMPQSELGQLIERMGLVGQLDPIVVLDGQVLDGWNRYLACKALNLEPWTTKFQDESDVDPREYVLARNLQRRHLSPGDRAGIAVRVYEWRPPGRPATTGSNDPVTRSVDQMASEAQVSTGTIKRAQAQVRQEESGEDPPVVEVRPPTKLQLALQDAESFQMQAAQLRTELTALHTRAADLERAASGEHRALVDELQSTRRERDRWMEEHATMARLLKGRETLLRRIRKAAESGSLDRVLDVLHGGRAAQEVLPRGGD